MIAAARRVVIVPGSFDPMTNGHLDIVARAAALFDEVIVAVLVNPTKTSLLSVDTRVAACASAVAAWSHVRVEQFDGLLVNLARRHDACAVVRGLRSGGDFDYEWPMARLNRELLPALDTVLLPASPQWAHVSANLVRDIYRLGGDIVPFVPAAVLPYLPGRPNDTD